MNYFGFDEEHIHIVDCYELEDLEVYYKDVYIIG